MEIIYIEDPLNKVTISEWNRFFTETMINNKEINFKFNFKVLSSKYDKAYIHYLKVAYLIKDTLNDEEFCKLNCCSIEIINKLKL